MIKHSHLNDYFSKQTSPADHKSQSCGSKGRDLYITIITASYWPLIVFIWGIMYLGTAKKREMFVLCISAEYFGVQKGGQRKPRTGHTKFIVKGYPQVAVCGFLRTRRRPHVDNPRESEMYRQSGKISSLKFIFVDLKVPLCY